MIEFKKPDWLKNRMGKVVDRIGQQGSIQIDKISKNKVFLKLINENGSFEILPASNALSQLLITKQIKPIELKEFDILELTDGQICIGQVISHKI
jgi:hypothetical protein